MNIVPYTNKTCYTMQLHTTYNTTCYRCHLQYYNLYRVFIKGRALTSWLEPCEEDFICLVWQAGECFCTKKFSLWRLCLSLRTSCPLTKKSNENPDKQILTTRCYIIPWRKKIITWCMISALITTNTNYLHNYSYNEYVRMFHY